MQIGALKALMGKKVLQRENHNATMHLEIIWPSPFCTGSLITKATQNLVEVVMQVQVTNLQWVHTCYLT